MSVLDSRNIAVSCCLIFFTIVNFNRGTSETNISQKDFTGVSEDCGKRIQFNKSGSYSLEIRENCNKYFVHLNTENNASIINLKVSIQYLKQDEEWVNKAKTLKSTFKVILCDLPANTDTCKGRNVLKKEWQEDPTTIPRVISHLSRSWKVFVEISGNGNWSYYEITFSYKEIPYRLTQITSQDESNMVSCKYTPNSVSLLQLQPQKPQRGIEIQFKNLTINTEMGEYILIGAGIKPFGNKNSRPLYITQVTENSTFFVDDSSAFVAFVSGSLQRPSANENFKIRWKGVNADTDNVAKIVVADSNSSLICFYNYTAALEEYNKENRFEIFRQHFADISKAYLQGEYKGVQDEINNGSIDLSGQPMKTKEKDALAILIRVMYGEKSIFTWSTLQSIIAESKENGTRILGYEVDVCPHKNYVLPDKEKWDIVFYGLVPVFGILGLLMWAWKQNLFSQNCLTEKEEKALFDPIHAEPAEPNMYGMTTAPKMRYEEGRRNTIQGLSLQEDAGGTKHATMVEMNAMPSTSQEPDTLTRYLSGKSNRSRPSLQSLLDNVEEIKKQPHPIKTEGNESDHLYDSVSNSKQLDETKL